MGHDDWGNPVFTPSNRNVSREALPPRRGVNTAVSRRIFCIRAPVPASFLPDLPLGTQTVQHPGNRGGPSGVKPNGPFSASGDRQRGQRSRNAKARHSGRGWHLSRGSSERQPQESFGINTRSPAVPRLSQVTFCQKDKIGPLIRGLYRGLRPSRLPGSGARKLSSSTTNLVEWVLPPLVICAVEAHPITAVCRALRHLMR
jgi:hypothetical protein